jgi:ribose/xylose/arabinose/galactoside ABC-type transport system permease subunit
MTAASETGTAVRGGAEKRRRFVQQNAVLLVVVAFIILATIVSGGRFIQPSNIAIILFQASVIGVLALGQMLVMLIAGIDLSIVAIAILAAIVMGAGGSERQQEMNLAGGILPFIGFWPAIALAIVGSAMLGAINGLAAVALRIPPFIATLAMSLALGGLAMLTTSGTPVHYPDPFFAEFGHTKILGVPLPVYVFLGLALALGLFLSRTKYGIMIYAIGGNPRAARLSGIPIETITIFIYTLSGLLGGIAGFVFLARTGSVTVGSAGNLLLNTIAAVVVGGVSLYGGKGSVRSAMIGTLLLAGLGNLMNILLVSPHLQNAISSLIILAAIMINGRLDKDLSR